MEFFRFKNGDVIASFYVSCDIPKNPKIFNFPTPDKVPIRFITTYFFRVENKKFKPIDNNIFTNKVGEKEMIMSWINFIKENKTNIILSWNLFMFEYNYIEERCKQLNILRELKDIATIKYSYPGNMKTKKKGERMWISKYDNNITLIDIMVYTQHSRRINGKMGDFANDLNLEYPKFSGYYNASTDELKEYSSKMCDLQMKIFYKIYTDNVKKYDGSLEELKKFIKEKGEYIEDTDPVFFDSKKYMRKFITTKLTKEHSNMDFGALYPNYY